MKQPDNQPNESTQPASEHERTSSCAVPDTESICPVCGAQYHWEHAHMICPRCKIPQSCCN
ncbi:hypothetical protein [Vulgatibacter sp.]|uniref:hypothetical protein n=1 Tax=Vulgatibacter sp. TaxID=1971226 RepID=UPI00356357C9